MNRCDPLRLFKLGVTRYHSSPAAPGQGEREAVGVRNGVFCLDLRRREGKAPVGVYNRNRKDIQRRQKFTPASRPGLPLGNVGDLPKVDV